MSEEKNVVDDAPVGEVDPEAEWDQRTHAALTKVVEFAINAVGAALVELQNEFTDDDGPDLRLVHGVLTTLTEAVDAIGQVLFSDLDLDIKRKSPAPRNQSTPPAFGDGITDLLKTLRGALGDAIAGKSSGNGPTVDVHFMNEGESLEEAMARVKAERTEVQA